MLEINDRRAFSTFNIISFNLIAVLVLIAFSAYLYFKAKNTPLLKSYLFFITTILLWMVSKILKTVAPTESLRWFFIVTQYLGVQFLGFFLLVFAHIYTKNTIPPKRTLFLLAIIPIAGFILVITNPWHMLFFSRYDFYRTSFGPLFVPSQIFLYLYVMIGTIKLSKGFTKQAAFKEKKRIAHTFAFLTILPMLFNVYYIIFKLSDIKWVFPFPVFDFTPIAISLSLILFMIPAVKNRFLDISLISYNDLLNSSPKSIAFINHKGFVFSSNYLFKQTFDDASNTLSFREFFKRSFCLDYTSLDDLDYLTVKYKQTKSYRVCAKKLKNKNHLITFTDITHIVKLKADLELKNEELKALNVKLEELAQNKKELTITKTQNSIAQNIHDILGHSITVVLASAELSMFETDKGELISKISYIKELLYSSLSDIKNSIQGNHLNLDKTSLVSAITKLKNPKIDLDLMVQGNPFELNSTQTEAVFRLCQEAITNAIKHGLAQKIHIVIRYNANEVEVYAIDDGVGCSEIFKSYGLQGIEERINSLSGVVSFGSDGEAGFHIHAKFSV